VLYVKFFVSVVFGAYFFWITCRNAIFTFNWNQIKLALVFSLPLVPGDIAYYFSTMFDRVLIDKYMTAAAVGVFSTAATLASMLNIISYGSYKAFEPHFFKTYGDSGFNSDFEKIRDSLLYIILILGIFLCIFSRDFLFLFSSTKYHEAYLYVPLLVLGVIANSLQMMYSTVLTAQSKTKIAGIISIACAIISVTFNILLIPVIGMWSAAIANVLVYIIGWLLCKYFTHMKVEYRKAFIVCVLFICIIVFCVYLLKIDNLFLSYVLKVACILFYIIISGYIFNIRPVALINNLIHRRS
jgi:O-antigen/teichoic acid export membrane protein